MLEESSACQDRDYTLERHSELRVKIKQPDAKVMVMRLAELFGAELVKKKKYEFGMDAKVAIFSYQGCVLRVTGNMDVCYISKVTPMVQYLNCHAELEQLRVEAEKRDERGPVVLVAGPVDVGKSTLCRILLNYAVRNGRRPLHADIDVGQGAICIPGSISTILIDRPAKVEEGFPLVYHFGHKSPSDNNVLYDSVISRMAAVTLESLDANKRTKHSGIIVNTCGWVTGSGYTHLLQAAKAYRARTIFVLDLEGLYNKLRRDLDSDVKVVLLPKSGGGGMT